MLFQQDWLMRQIEYYIQLLARLIFRRDRVYYEIRNTAESEVSDWLYRELNALLADCKINEAENLLFKYMDRSNKDFLIIAIEFYTKLNRYDGDELGKMNFSREEVHEGLTDVMKHYGIEQFLEK